MLLGAVLLGAGAAAVAALGQAPPPAPAQPFVAQGEKLVPPDVHGKEGHVGRDIALSQDGNTALIGAPHDGREAGAAWVYVRSGSTWSEQARLELPSAEGSSYFGRGVALSADGNTAVVGDPGHAENTGAAWVFARTGTEWKLVSGLVPADESGQGQYGRSVALSADGTLALVGAFADNGRAGAAWTFARTGSTWTQQGSKLTGAEEAGGGMFGRDVALSADGATAAVGGSNDSAGIGAVWTYTRSGAGWEQLGPKLAGGTEEVGRGAFGESVGLSGDGSTLLVGAPHDAVNTGAAWAFARSGSAWTQQGAKLTGGEEEVPPASFGFSVSLSGDGSVALVGGPVDNERQGAAWAFDRAEGHWSLLGSKLTGAGETTEGRFGYGVALSGDGTTAMAGGITDGAGIGAAWPFVQGPPPPPPVEPEETHTTTISTSTSATPPPAGGVLSDVTVSDPVLATTGNVDPVRGKIRVKLPNHRNFEVLPGLRQIPMGAIVDATEGHVVVTVASKSGGTQTGEFFSGQFVLSQNSSGVVFLTLTGGKLARCPTVHKHRRHHSARAHHARAQAAKARRKRKLWANAHGTFSTKGNYAVGAVQGTEWLTEDTCEGTYIRVTRDKVKVTDLVHHKSHIVTTGHSILVRHP